MCVSIMINVIHRVHITVQYICCTLYDIDYACAYGIRYTVLKARAIYHEYY